MSRIKGRLASGRLAAAGFLGTALLVGPAVSGAMAAGQCGISSARQAFDVQGLKSELMVTALSCNAQERYNAFVEKFRGDLSAEESTLNGYFRTNYGRGAQKAHDDYITQLANVQSEKGLKAGTAFCQQRVSMFDEVAVLENASDLGSYAEAKDIVQPASYETCAAPSASEHPARVRRIKAVSRGHKG
ncbi:hypothetical protein [Rhizosaccharibacter radicis]|uniref:Uncharacterized protein n=1 Tax=Rhizosaccharibacter radicis TaxID=2782605 RepID=A0ABT1W1B7_9PROT|nr:hypothetical protein [Acetobacteraceae bacterium KSS12]